MNCSERNKKKSRKSFEVQLSTTNLTNVDSKTSTDTNASSLNAEEECSGCLVKNLNGIILQYLENYGLDESYITFCRECKVRGVPFPEVLQNPSFLETTFRRSDAGQLLQHFDKEQGKEMLELWTKFVKDVGPSEMEGVKKITFYLYVYKAIIPYRQHKSTKEKAKGMSGLHNFFQEKSNESYSENMLSLFALPFVPDPTVHPTFKNLFQDSWRDKLRSQLTSILEYHFQRRLTRTLSQCDLTRMFLSWMRLDDSSESDKDNHLHTETTAHQNRHDKSVQTEEHYLSLDAQRLKSKDSETRALFRKQNNEIDLLKKNLKSCEDRYYKLLCVTGEVVGSLEKAVQGKAQDTEDLMHRLQLVFPELFPSARIRVVQEVEKQMIQQSSKTGSFENERNAIPEIARGGKHVNCSDGKVKIHYGLHEICDEDDQESNSMEFLYMADSNESLANPLTNHKPMSLKTQAQIKSSRKSDVSKFRNENTTRIPVARRKSELIKHQSTTRTRTSDYKAHALISPKQASTRQATHLNLKQISQNKATKMSSVIKSTHRIKA